MKKVLMSIALVAFLGATVVTANTLGTEKEKTSKTDDKKSKRKKKAGCEKSAAGGCCHKGEASKTTNTENKPK